MTAILGKYKGAELDLSFFKFPALEMLLHCPRVNELCGRRSLVTKPAPVTPCMNAMSPLLAISVLPCRSEFMDTLRTLGTNPTCGT
jgi:hypothetical protein